MKKEPKEFKYNRNKIPRNSGCYLFFDDKKTLLYVGKAKDLRKRVSSYFQKTKKAPKTATMVKKIAKIETRIVNSEMEALILENNLIKEFMPRFNILLRDDKNFLYLRVTKEDFPRLEITRRIVRDGSFYVGPKTSAKKFRETVNFCQKVFQIRTCRLGMCVNSAKKIEITANSERKKIPCLDFHIKKCSGPCAGKISREKYGDQVELMKKFLRGETKEVIKNLQTKMMAAAAEKKFEAAGKIRDLIKSIESSTEKQRVQFEDQISRDFLNFYRTKRHVYFVRLSFRHGRFIDQNEVKFTAEEFLDDAEVWGKVLLQFYEKVDQIPAKILLPTAPENKEQLEELLKTKIIIPQKGDKVRVLEMAEKSAKNLAKKSQIDAMAQEEIFAQALPRLAEKLGLENPPRRMECYDISHFNGTHTVASQVVFIDGKPKSSEYRRFKIKSLETGEIDDFASMKEVLERRFKSYSQKSTKSREIFEIRKIEDKKTKTKLLKFGNKIFNEELGFPSEIQDKSFDEKLYSHWGAFNEKGKIVGIIKIKKFAKSVWQITGLAVDKQFRGNSIGTKLILEAGKFSLENDVKKLFVISDKTAETFYKDFGFEINKKPLKKIATYIDKISKKYAETNTIWESYEWKITKPKTEIPRNPDLIVIDGGKGQLSAVLKVLKNMPNLPLDIEKQVISLAKREEEIFRGKFQLPSPDLAQDKNLSKSGLKATEIVFEKIEIDSNSAESKLLQRIRDEAHRFAISFNRNLREKSAKKSRLDEIRGIGPKTKKELLQKFESPAGIRNASDEELLEILNTKQLENLRKNL